MFDQLRNLCYVLSRAGHSANSFANFTNSANSSIGNAVAKQFEDLPANVAKSLDEWVERTRRKGIPNCAPSLPQEAWIYAELGIPETVSQIPQLRNLNCALSKFFCHLQNLRYALNSFLLLAL